MINLEKVNTKRSRFKTRINNTVYIGVKLNDFGRVDVVFFLDKKDVVIFKNEKCIMTSDLVDENLLNQLMDAIYRVHCHRIEDVVQILGLTFSREDFERSFGISVQELEKRTEALMKSMNGEQSDIEKLRTEKSEQNKLMLRDNLFKLNRLMGKAIEELEKRLECKPNEIIKICRSFKPIFNILNSINSIKKIKVYLAEEQRPYSTNHYKIGMTTQQTVEDRMNPTDNPYGLNYICFVEYSANNGFNLEKTLQEFFKFYSTKKIKSSGSSEWFYFKNRKSIIKHFKKISSVLCDKYDCSFEIITNQ